MSLLIIIKNNTFNHIKQLIFLITSAINVYFCYKLIIW
jgi:hypothetical protein